MKQKINTFLMLGLCWGVFSITNLSAQTGSKILDKQVKKVEKTGNNIKNAPEKTAKRVENRTVTKANQKVDQTVDKTVDKVLNPKFDKNKKQGGGGSDSAGSPEDANNNVANAPKTKKQIRAERKAARQQAKYERELRKDMGDKDYEEWVTRREAIEAARNRPPAEVILPNFFQGFGQMRLQVYRPESKKDSFTLLEDRTLDITANKKQTAVEVFATNDRSKRRFGYALIRQSNLKAWIKMGEDNKPIEYKDSLDLQSRVINPEQQLAETRVRKTVVNRLIPIEVRQVNVYKTIDEVVYTKYFQENDSMKITYWANEASRDNPLVNLNLELPFHTISKELKGFLPLCNTHTYIHSAELIDKRTGLISLVTTTRLDKSEVDHPFFFYTTKKRILDNKSEDMDINFFNEELKDLDLDLDLDFELSGGAAN
jgi:hypothetical protein